jgi:hypothetical protein
MVTIKSNFDLNKVRSRLNGAVEQRVKMITTAYKAAGIDFVDTARRNKTFGDITHDLVSSMGCILVVNHAEVFNYFPGFNENGVSKGLAYAREIALLVDDGGIVLVCVAGMEYARAVEDRGKDVITGTDLKFKRILSTHLAAIKR